MGRLKVMTILGTRPEIIRLSTTIPLLDRHCDHYLVHTGQNYDENLSDVFFKELGIRAPDEYLSVKAGTWSGLIAQIIEKAAAAMKKVKPDRVLILGDTNSGMAAFAAARLNIPVFHIEGGNRCYDDRVPEEVNRRVIDACSTVLMAYTNRSKENLLDEGYPREWIHVIGNPMFEVLKAYEKQIEASDALRSFKLKPRKYIAVTLHRSENVDVKRRLKEILETLEEAGKKYKVPVVVSLHPRTADRSKAHALDLRKFKLVFTRPLGLFDWVKLEKNAFAVLSDSGTLQDECSIFRVPLVTLRDVTERGETLETGSNIMAGADRETILRALALALEAGREWTIPPEYLEPQVSVTIAKIVLGHLPHRRHRAQA